MSPSARDKWAELGLAEGDTVMRVTHGRYDRAHFPTVFLVDRWTVHPCAQGSMAMEGEALPSKHPHR